jgi:hypothetical protein
MSDFDDFELRRQLRAAAGSEPDIVAAQSMLVGRVSQARRRRAAALSSSAAVVALLFVGGFALRSRHDPAASITPATEVATSDHTSTSAEVTDSSSTTSEPSTTVTVPESLDDPNPSAPGNGAVNGGSAAGTVTTESDSSNSGSSNSDSSNSGSSNSSSTSAPTSTHSSTPTTKDFASIGGSVRIRLEAGAMTIVSIDETADFESEIERNDGNRIVVKFTLDDDESKVSVRLIDGVMVQDGDGADSSSGDHSESGPHGGTSTSSPVHGDDNDD